jgi:predicted lipoprotein with Yx(FWY)xxD motif
LSDVVREEADGDFPTKGNFVIPQRIVLASAAGLVSAFLLAACGSSNDNASSMKSGNATPVATAASDPASSAPATSAPADSGDSGSGHMATTTMLMAKAVKGMGSVVTDDKGMTLYRYDKDQATPSKWTCAGECTKTWMPVMVQGSVRTMGVKNSLLGTVHRNGMKQVTLDGWPLYRYMGDTEAGQMNGQGKGRQWYAVTPTGQKSTMTA